MENMDVIEKIRDFIMKRAGLYFKEYDMPSLREKITERMQATKCPTRWELRNILDIMSRIEYSIMQI